ncbi:glutathione peroxidase [Volvox carteri f. nagariensis]|uniref:Glutathione peroxidase n=1 Tax=Volvox carteri f. nagariensis TaxID=3068 RepID=D8TV69_VOLCA|nr:glutathione peroxidase [Volvox carteri f. nagariensis]EFJ48651.1 glutathione peroxidase [Volvox carteri f. nagariensis]|eukprot:XP_002950450.1 glutathione peroxidase [Volvox carteri f. nagariensis]
MMLQSRIHARPATRIAARPARHHALKTQALFGFGGAKTAEPSTSEFYSFTVKDIDGKSFPLSTLKGKAVLVVNLASQCGFTPQYNELQAIYDKFGKQGFTVLGFPCNQFGAQEPGSNQSIKAFAKSQYGVTFPLMSKVDVNGPGAEPLFNWLKTQKGGVMGNDIKWNFSKFLVDKEGVVVGRYASTATPGSLEGDIRKALGA